MKRPLKSSSAYFQLLKAKQVSSFYAMSAELAKRVGDDAAREILQWRSSPERRKATPEEISHEIEFLNGTFERSMAVALTVDYWFIKGALDCAEKYPEVFGTEIGIQGCGNGIYACILRGGSPSQGLSATKRVIC